MKSTPFSVRTIARSNGVHRLVRLGVGGLFLYAGALKLSDPLSFAIQMEKYGLLPASWLEPAAWLLPSGEILAGLATMLGLRGGSEATGLLLLLFLGVLGYAWWSGLDVPCGCFSLEDEADRHGIQLAILRDLLLLAGAGFLIWRRRLSLP